MAKDNKSQLTKEEEVDARLATAMGEAALGTPEMQQGIVGMVQSAEPVMASGQVLANMIMQMKEKADEQGLNLSDRIWMAQGGVADRLADRLANTVQSLAGVPIGDQGDAIWEEALNVFKLAMQTQQGGQAPGAPQAPQAAPQGMGPMGAAQQMGMAV